MTRQEAPPPHYVSIQAEALMAAPDATATGIDRLARAGFGDLGQHIGPIHVGLLAVVWDLGAVPVPEAMRASRDIRDIVHSLADLETLGLLGRRRDRVFLAEGVNEALGEALEATFLARARAARQALVAATTPSAARRGEDVARWLRNIAVLVANQGVRRTRAGELHAGDLRRLQGMCELPPRRFLETALRVGEAMEVVFALDDRLLIGDAIDLLDLDRAAFGATALADVAAGVIDLGHGHVTAMGGGLTRWAELLADHFAPRGEGLPSLIAPMSPEPVSDFLPEPDASWQSTAAMALGEAHARLRLGLIALIGQLPVGRELPMDAVVKLVHAHIALDLLRRPCRPIPVGGQQPSLLAEATHILPFAEARVREHLPAWIQQVFTPLGAASVDDGALTLFDRQPRLVDSRDGTFVVALDEGEAATERAPRRAGSIVVQPTGEILAPPDVSIHGLLHLAQGAELVRLDEVVTFAIDRRSLLRLVHSGMDVTVWCEAVADLSRTPLPVTVVELVNDAAARQGELTLAPAGGVLIARDPVRLDELLSHPRFAALTIARPADNVAILAAGCDLERLVGDINEAGFGGMLVDRPPRAGESGAGG